jgi:AcrR family transcriptional regulator
VPRSATRLAPPVRPRRRRTHAERTAETRARLIAAVVDSIADLGVHGATAQVIVARAGITWGAVQHHFGGKDGLLLAVLEDSFARFAERLRDLPLDVALDERVALFVERAWAHFRSRHYRSTFEILLNFLGREEQRGGDWREQMQRAWDGVWSRIFSDARLPRRRSLMLQHFTVATLSGLASTLMLEGPTAVLPRWELGLLKDTLVRELARSG